MGLWPEQAFGPHSSGHDEVGCGLWRGTWNGEVEWLPRSSLARLVCASLFCTFRLPAPPSFFHLPAHARCHPPALARNGGEKVRYGLCFNKSRPSYLRHNSYYSPQSDERIIANWASIHGIGLIRRRSYLAMLLSSLLTERQV